jgi:RNA polymerase sigma-70 factor (ECF subfamily)
MAHDLTDEELAEGCRCGDREAQRQLYVRTSERVYRLLLKMTRDAEQAFDLAQDTYVRAFTRIEQFDGRSSLGTWLYRIAVNEALQFMRRTATARAGQERLAEPPVSECDNPQAAARIDVADALATLPPEDRAILLLRYQEGLDYAAIAEITGCPDGTVASRLSRARARMRGLLEKGYGGREEGGAAAHPNIGSPSGVEEPVHRVSPGARRTGAK